LPISASTGTGVILLKTVVASPRFRDAHC
jgi:hypothetical protein